MGAAAVLSLRGIGFAYTPEPPVFDALSADIGAGVTWLLGDEGSGKTTLLRLLAGDLAGRGTIRIGGEPLADTGGRRPVAWCDAGAATLDPLSVGGLIDRLRAATPAFDDTALERHVAGFGLGPHLGKAMFQLSTGTRRKVALAAVFAMRATVTLLDDPAASLDAPSVEHLWRTLGAADRDPSRVCLVAAYAVPLGVGSPRTLVLPPRG